MDKEASAKLDKDINVQVKKKDSLSCLVIDQSSFDKEVCMNRFKQLYLLLDTDLIHSYPTSLLQALMTEIKAEQKLCCSSIRLLLP